MTSPAQIAQRFGYHKVTDPEIIDKMIAVRATTARVAGDYAAWLPEGREKSLALTALQEAQMWAIAALAMQEPLDQPWGDLVESVAREATRFRL